MFLLAFSLMAASVHGTVILPCTTGKRCAPPVVKVPPNCFSESCLKPSYSVPPIQYIPIMMSDISIIIPVVHSSLPPDPAEAGKATLLGVDSDGDGIRDDVNRYIAQTYWNDPYAELIYKKNAKTIQNIFKSTTNPSIIDSEVNKLINITRCMTSMYQYNDIVKMNAEFRKIMFNTMDRYKNWLLSQSQFAGKSYTSSQLNYGEYCPAITQY